jgi:hypothetical protein
MAVPVVDYVKSFILCLPVIYEWRLQRSALMMNGVEVGRRFCNIDSLPPAHLMDMPWEIFFSLRSGIATEIPFKESIELARY